MAKRTRKLRCNLIKNCRLCSSMLTSINVKHMSGGEVRVFGERPGHTNGYQRMSLDLDASGERTRIVQTALCFLFNYAELMLDFNFQIQACTN